MAGNTMTGLSRLGLEFLGAREMSAIGYQALVIDSDGYHCRSLEMAAGA